MDNQLQEWIRWGMSGIGTLAIVYARYLHGHLDKLREQIGAQETKIATVSASTATLTRVENDLSSLTKVVYRIAGHLGVPTGD